MLFDKTMSFLEGGLTLRQHRHATITGNIANAETPNYRARRTDFSDALARIEKLHAQNKPLDISPTIETSQAPGRQDGNNVQLEEETSLLVANHLEFQALTTMARKKFSLLRYTVERS